MSAGGVHLHFLELQHWQLFHCFPGGHAAISTSSRGRFLLVRGAVDEDPAG